MFSDFDLGSPFSPELNPEVEERKPEIRSEFKLPNLEDFELRSKTPKKIHVSHKLESHQVLNNASTSEVFNKLSPSEVPNKFSRIPTEKLSKLDRSLSPERSTKVFDDSSLDSPVVVQRKLSKKIALKFDSSSEDEEIVQQHLQEEEDERKKIR